jgi:hypothetical protein
MPNTPSDEKPLKIRGLLGLGLDGDREHKRVTRGPNFRLFGGSRETHERMLDTAMKFNNLVDARGKRLHEVNARELREISAELSDEMA